MDKMDERELDSIFQDGIQEQEFAYNPASWATMNDRLDKRDRNRKVVFLLLFLGVSIAALVAYNFMQHESNTQAGAAKENAEVPTDSEESVSIDAADLVDSKELAKIQTKREDMQQSLESKDSGTVTGKLLAAEVGQTRNSESSPTLLAVEPVVEYPSNTIAKDNYNNPAKLATVAKQESVEFGKGSDGFSSSKTFYIPTLPEKATQGTATLNAEVILTKTLSPYETDMANELVSPSRRFFVSAYVAPEWSSINFLENARRGYRAGINFGIPLSKNLEMSIGVGLSHKNFIGTGKDYLMEGGWKGNVMPMEMKSTCNIIDVPITIAYYLNGHDQNGFFFEGGVSNFFISKEWYGFEYDPEALDLLQVEEPVVEITEFNQNNHFVGVANLGIGYQKVLNSKYALQVIPYTQIPLTGIGSGQVNLNSSGVKILFKFSK